MKHAVVLITLILLAPVYAEEIELLEEESTINTRLFGACSGNYNQYSCMEVHGCESDGESIAYPGLCPNFGEAIKCCIPKNNFRELKHIYDNAGVITEENEAAINEFLKKTEDEFKSTIVFVIESSIDGDPSQKLREIYEEENMGRSSYKTLLLLDLSTDQMHARGKCAYFTSQVYDILMSDTFQNKRFLDEKNYDAAFSGAAFDAYMYFKEDPKRASCQDAEIAAAVDEFLIESSTGTSRLQRIYNLCKALPGVINIFAAKSNKNADAEQLSETVCKQQLRNEILSAMRQEKDRIQASIDNSYQSTQYVEKIPTCADSEVDKHGCIRTGDGSIALGTCENVVPAFTYRTGRGDYTPVPTPGGAVNNWKIGSDRYDTYDSCRRACEQKTSCAAQDESSLPLDYGTDNPLQWLEGKWDRRELDADKNAIELISNCYEARTRDSLHDILDNSHLCPGISLLGTAPIGRGFTKNAVVRTYDEIERIWNSGQTIDEDTMCEVSIKVAEGIDNPSTSFSTITTQDKINAYAFALYNCRAANSPVGNSNVAVAVDRINTLSQTGFLYGTWTVAKSFGDPTNLAIIGTTVAATGGMSLFGASARSIKMLHTATTSFFTVQMSVHLPDAISACQESDVGLPSQSCGEAVAQALMLGIMLRSTINSASELRSSTTEATVANLEKARDVVVADLSKQRETLIRERASLDQKFMLEGCVIGICELRLRSRELIDKDIENIERKLNTLRQTERTQFEYLAELLRISKEKIYDTPLEADMIIFELKKVAAGNSELSTLVRTLENRIAESSKPQTVTAPSQRGVEINGKRMAPVRQVPISEIITPDQSVIMKRALDEAGFPETVGQTFVRDWDVIVNAAKDSSLGPDGQSLTVASHLYAMIYDMQLIGAPEFVITRLEALGNRVASQSTVSYKDVTVQGPIEPVVIAELSRPVSRGTREGLAGVLDAEPSSIFSINERTPPVDSAGNFRRTITTDAGTQFAEARFDPAGKSGQGTIRIGNPADFINEQGGRLGSSKLDVDLQVLRENGVELTSDPNFVIVATDNIGDLGYITGFKAQDGGFVVRKVELSQRAVRDGIRHVASSLYKEAHERYGSYRGPWPLHRTPEGALFMKRMQESNPQIFEGYNLDIEALIATE